MHVVFNVPSRAKRARKVTVEQAQGRLFVILVGSENVRFVLQDSGALSHWASGHIVSRQAVQAIKIELMARVSYCSWMSDRQACVVAVERLVATYGAAKLLESMSRAPVINTTLQRAPVSAKSEA